MRHMHVYSFSKCLQNNRPVQILFARSMLKTICAVLSLSVLVGANHRAKLAAKPSDRLEGLQDDCLVKVKQNRRLAFASYPGWLMLCTYAYSRLKSVVTLSLLLPMMATGLLAAAFQNGSFELGVLPPTRGGETLASGSTDIAGWVVLPSNIDWIGFAGNAVASQGSWFLDLNGSTTGGIEQTFDTVLGTQYTVTFDMNANSGSAALSLQLSAGATTQNFTFTPTLPNNSSPWAKETFSFVATSSQSNLMFQSLVLNSNGGPMIDNVSVSGTSSPEPTGIMLCLMSAFFTFLLLRRKIAHGGL